MINIDFLTLKAFLIENIDFFIGSRLQKIQQPTRRDFILTLRNNSETKKFYVNINPQIYHIAFISKETEQKRYIKYPKQPPMFCMLLRKYLEGCRISDAKVVENERILELHFESYNELKEKILLCLAIELMGKHSNVILYNKDTSLIIGCAHNVGAEKSKYRELKGGLKYIYPPVTGKTFLSNELTVQFKTLRNDEISSYLTTEIFRPAILGEKYTLFKELLPNSIETSDVNEMIDSYYSEFQSKYILESEQNELLEIINRKLKKTHNSINNIQNLLRKRDNCDKYKLYGELLTANLYINANYVESVELWDYTSNQNIIIELDKTKNMKENAQRYFKLYNKSKTTKEKSQEMLKSLFIEKEYFDNVLYSIEKTENMEELDDIKAELGINDNIIIKDKKKTNIQQIQKTNINNFDVYIGKNNRQNEYIISKLAKDNDYWFHTKDCAGSHVLLKITEKEPDENTIYECCKLARQHSSAKLPSKIGIIYTKAKNLKKPPSTPLGYVTYKNEKEILI